MSTIQDYSQIENFNLAAIEAVKFGYNIEDALCGKTEVKYYYKGRLLKVKADFTLSGDKVIHVGVISVEQVKEYSNE